MVIKIVKENAINGITFFTILFLPLISPVVMSSLINTRERAIALEIRGFGGKLYQYK